MCTHDPESVSRVRIDAYTFSFGYFRSSSRCDQRRLLRGSVYCQRSRFYYVSTGGNCASGLLFSADDTVASIGRPGFCVVQRGILRVWMAGACGLNGWRTGSPSFTLRKEAGLTMLVTAISTSSRSTVTAWYFRNTCGESQCPPFTSSTADAVWDASTVTLWPEVNLHASWMFNANAATALRHTGRPLAAASDRLEK